MILVLFLVGSVLALEPALQPAQLEVDTVQLHRLLRMQGSQMTTAMKDNLLETWTAYWALCKVELTTAMTNPSNTITQSAARSPCFKFCMMVSLNQPANPAKSCSISVQKKADGTVLPPYLAISGSGGFNDAGDAANYLLFNVASGVNLVQFPLANTDANWALMYGVMPAPYAPGGNFFTNFGAHSAGGAQGQCSEDQIVATLRATHVNGQKQNVGLYTVGAPCPFTTRAFETSLAWLNLDVKYSCNAMTDVGAFRAALRVALATAGFNNGAKASAVANSDIAWGTMPSGTNHCN